MSGIYLYTQTQKAKLLELIHIPGHRASVTAQLLGQRRNAHSLLSDHLAEPNPLRRQATDHVERVREGEDPLRLHPLTLRHFLGALQGMAHMPFQSVAESLILHSFSCVTQHLHRTG